MACLRFDPEFLWARLFPGVPDVRITAVGFDERGHVMFEVEGGPIPRDAREVRVIVHTSREPNNGPNDRLTERFDFKAAEKLGDLHV